MPMPHTKSRIDLHQWQDCAEHLLNDPRVMQISRVQALTQPTGRNPSWLHTHRDLDYLLRLLERYARGEIAG